MQPLGASRGDFPTDRIVHGIVACIGGCRRDGPKFHEPVFFREDPVAISSGESFLEDVERLSPFGDLYTTVKCFVGVWAGRRGTPREYDCDRDNYGRDAKHRRPGRYAESVGASEHFDHCRDPPNKFFVLQLS